MNVLQQRGDLVFAAALKTLLQVSDHAIEISKYHIDCDGERRFRDMRRLVARGRTDGKPDQLPWRAEPVHDEKQRIKENVAMARDRGIEQRFDVFELLAGEITDG